MNNEKPTFTKEQLFTGIFDAAEDNSDISTTLKAGLARSMERRNPLMKLLKAALDDVKKAG